MSRLQMLANFLIRAPANAPNLLAGEPENGNRGMRSLFQPRDEWPHQSPVRSLASAGCLPESALGLDERDDAVEPLALLEIGHHERPRAPHASRISIHFFQGGPDVGRKVDLVDDQEIGTGNARPAF